MRFIGIDGEAVNNKYVLLCANDSENTLRQSVENLEGLSTRECLEFLWTLSTYLDDVRFVGFAFSYDTNMILECLITDANKGKLQTLCEDKRVNIPWSDNHTCEITFIPNKFTRFDKWKYTGRNRKRIATITIEDTFGFYQQSFVKALKAWKLDDETTLKRIEEGKAGRGDFELSQFPTIKDYCFSECQELAKLTNKLRNAMDSAGIEVRSYIGAGAVAQAFMLKHNVKAHHEYDKTYGSEVHLSIMQAYYGGRVEMFRQGFFPSGATTYDIKSAYPTECLSLPSLRGGTWDEYTGSHGALLNVLYDNPYCLCQVEWHLDNGKSVVTPFPLRLSNGAIWYLPDGKGWYWQNEVKTALRYWPNEIHLKTLLVFTPATEEKPFNFIRNLYDLRLQAQRNGLASEKVYKLGLNSLYGKTAQGTMYRGGNRQVRLPALQSYVWAGMITSGTRARVLDMIAPHPDKVIASNTDGIVFLSDPKFPVSSELGGLEKDSYETLLYLQNGVYFADGEGVRKTRGHILTELDYETILKGWLANQINYVYEYTTRRFIGMHYANHIGNLSIWRQWLEMPRKLNCFQDGPTKYSEWWKLQNEHIQLQIDEPYLPDYMVSWQWTNYAYLTLYAMRRKSEDYLTYESQPFQRRKNEDNPQLKHNTLDAFLKSCQPTLPFR